MGPVSGMAWNRIAAMGTEHREPPKAESDAPLSPGFLWRKLVESWKRNPWSTIAIFVTIGGAVAATVSRIGPWLLPILGGVGLVVIVAGLAYFTWDVVRLKRLAAAPSDAWAEMLLRKEMMAAGGIMIAILVTMPSSWHSPDLHIAEAQMAEFRRELDAYLDRDGPDERTNEQKLADSMETLARNEEVIALARGVGQGQFVVRYTIAMWSLLLAVVQHGIVMMMVLLWIVRLTEDRAGEGREAGSEPPALADEPKA